MCTAHYTVHTMLCGNIWEHTNIFLLTWLDHLWIDEIYILTQNGYNKLKLLYDFRFMENVSA